jgi:hypothetical protein
MKKNVLVFGLIAGCIVSTFMAVSMAICSKDESNPHSMVLGYASMILSFSFIFIGIKNFRDKYNGGLIGFGKAFRIGLYIALIASTLYVAVWLVEYYMFIPDFMEKYAAHILRETKASGVSQLELDKKAAEMSRYKELYKNPIFVILFTYLEILPVGLIISLIAALLLKRKKLAVVTAGK